jgi:hypothetical protein
MDRPTLLAHEEHWTQESKPVNARLELLTSDETTLYTDLVEDVLGDAVRLEQERVRFSAIEHALQELAPRCKAVSGLRRPLDTSLRL